MRWQGTPSFATLLLVALACTAPLVYVLVRWPDNLFADDAYFYLQVAWNFSHGQGSTFNGLMPTNGYHPLWMLICSAVARCSPNKIVALHAVAALITALNLLATWTVAVLLRRDAPAGLPTAMVLLLPFLFVSQLGTEGALTAACLAVLLVAARMLLERPGPAAALSFAAAAGVTVLSRLDSVFLVLALTIGVLVSRGAQSRAMRRLLVPALLIPVVAWTGYLWTNLHFFGTWMPISGMLKLQRHSSGSAGANLPHVAWFSLAVIALGTSLRLRRRDLFFRAVEIPAALGVLVHAAVIAFGMSGETRWSWYYTTWVVVAAMIAGRTAALLAGRRLAMCLQLGAAAALLVLGAWNLQVRGHERAFSIGPAFQHAVVDSAHVRTLLAFDKPGRIAYLTTARVIPLDGLMTNIDFQRELAQQGVDEVIAHYGVDGFIGPAQPMGAAGRETFCNRLHLGATRFRCQADGGGIRAVAADVHARLTGTYAGTVPLPASSLVWARRDEVAVWRIRP